MLSLPCTAPLHPALRFGPEVPRVLRACPETRARSTTRRPGSGRLGRHPVDRRSSARSPATRRGSVVMAAAAAPASTGEALIVIDMQNDFCLPDAILRVNGAMDCLPQVVAAVEEARRRGTPVFWVIREHEPSGIDVERTRTHLFPPHGPGATVKGTPGAALVSPLAVADGELVVVKKRFSAFFQTPLDVMLRRLGTRRVVLCGVQTPNCIRSAAFDAVSLDYEQVTVLHDATASKSDEVQKANLEDMAAIGVEIVAVSDWSAEKKK
ncbi:unnamed protein product [Pedinophyceae sp. YPF-701]|nr:unnamed protein product [Pedinophyceae sp. YPF-701]